MNAIKNNLTITLLISRVQYQHKLFQIPTFKLQSLELESNMKIRSVASCPISHGLLGALYESDAIVLAQVIRVSWIPQGRLCTHIHIHTQYKRGQTFTTYARIGTIPITYQSVSPLIG